MSTAPAIPRMSVVNRDLNPLLADLPPWVDQIRPHQVRAVRDILNAFETTRLIFLDAPTGTGKTLIAETVRRLLRARALYVCTTKSLQHQFLHDYEYARVVMGRSNYPTVTLDMEFPDVTCEDCTIQSGSCQLCPEREECPYQIAKTEAARADVAVLNVAYLLNEARSRESMFKGRPLMVMDEADTIESELMRFVSIEISERRMSRWGWKPPEKVTVVESWREWLEEHVDALSHIASRHRTNAQTTDLKWQRENRFLVKLRAGMKDVLAGLETGVWVYTGVEGKGVSFKPSKVNLLGQNLWKITDGRWMLMSATPISVEERLDALGWEENYRTVRVESTFPVENRRVRYVPIGSMGSKSKDATVGKLATAVEDICLRHPHDRVLVHTVSYALTGELRRRIVHKLAPRRVLTYNQARDRELTLGVFKQKEASILLAPSMERGVDLPGELCRVQVITKIPYPYLGDRQVSARLHSSGGRTWYLCETIRTLVQMCGRAVRSREDWCETWILDSDFENLWQRGRGLFPKWYADSVIWRPESL